jgi:hypothetical protein
MARLSDDPTRREEYKQDRARNVGSECHLAVEPGELVPRAQRSCGDLQEFVMWYLKSPLTLTEGAGRSTEPLG